MCIVGGFDKSDDLENPNKLGHIAAGRNWGHSAHCVKVLAWAGLFLACENFGEKVK